MNGPPPTFRKAAIFAAVHESAHGTKRTSLEVFGMSAFDAVDGAYSAAPAC